MTLNTAPLLVWDYGTMAVLSFVGGMLYFIPSRQLVRYDDKLNILPLGNLTIGNSIEASSVETVHVILKDWT